MKELLVQYLIHDDNKQLLNSVLSGYEELLRQRFVLSAEVGFGR